MENIILIIILLVIIGGAGFYIYKTKKSGQACIGCPYAKTCNSNKCKCNCSEEK